MGQSGGYGAAGRALGIFALGLGALTLANCSGGPGRIDPRYGVSASTRVIEPGQPIPKGGGIYRVGKPYVVAGRTYIPEMNPHYSAVGMASWYGDEFHGRYTSNGEIFDENAITAAHPTLPLPSYARVTNLQNHKSIVVRVNDRGPFVGNRIIDLSIKSAKVLGFYGHGLAKVKVEYVGAAPLAGSDDAMLMSTLRQGEPAVAPVLVAANKTYVPTYFDARPMRDVPAPPDRPFRLGEGARDVPAVTTERTVAARAMTVDRAVSAEPPEATEASPVSAYAATRYDGHAVGFISGRGLY
jgi:rare lipoprotein A